MSRLVAHAGHDQPVSLGAGIGWHDWVELAIVMIGFVIVMTFIIRERRAK